MQPIKKVSLDDAGQQGDDCMVNAYEYLQITKRANNGVLRKAYRTKVRLCHPDVFGQNFLEEFLSLQRAYEILVNPETRFHLGHLRVWRRPRWCPQSKLEDLESTQRSLLKFRQYFWAQEHIRLSKTKFLSRMFGRL